MISGRPDLVVVKDDQALARAVAERFVIAGRNAIVRRGRFNVALAGGSTPKAAYTLVATAFADAVDWPRTRFFFGDERCVSPDDDESNYKMAKSTLLDALHIGDDCIFRMRGEDDPPAAARAYADILRGELGPELAFDLVMLGMGPDGHTASLFPGTDPTLEDAALVRAPFVEQFGTHRITLTPRVINAARAVAVATAGSSKAQALYAVLEGPRDPTRYPIQILEPQHGTLTWLVDEAAAAGLSR